MAAELAAAVDELLQIPEGSVLGELEETSSSALKMLRREALARLKALGHAVLCPTRLRLRLDHLVSCLSQEIVRRCLAV